MPNEIQADYASGNTLYAVIRDTAGQVWHVAGETFEDWGAGSHSADDYDITLADAGGSHYVGDFAEQIPGGAYSIQVFRQLGASPDTTDPLVSSRSFHWTGSGELTATKILANRTVQNRATGEIDYYDDDGQTVLFTHIMAETQAYVTRTPN